MYSWTYEWSGVQRNWGPFHLFVFFFFWNSRRLIVGLTWINPGLLPAASHASHIWIFHVHYRFRCYIWRVWTLHPSCRMAEPSLCCIDEIHSQRVYTVNFVMAGTEEHIVALMGLSIHCTKPNIMAQAEGRLSIGLQSSPSPFRSWFVLTVETIYCTRSGFYLGPLNIFRPIELHPREVIIPQYVHASTKSQIM